MEWKLFAFVVSSSHQRTESLVVSQSISVTRVTKVIIVIMVVLVDMAVMVRIIMVVMDVRVVMIIMVIRTDKTTGQTGQTGQTSQRGQTGQTDLTFKIDFPGNFHNYRDVFFIKPHFEAKKFYTWKCVTLRHCCVKSSLFVFQVENFILG